MEHTVTEVVGWIFAVAFGGKLLVDLLRTWGVIPEKRANGAATAKTVAQLSIESFKSIIHQEIEPIRLPLIALRAEVRGDVRDEIAPLLAKLSENTSKTLDKLDQINVGIHEVATILRERKRE